MRGAFFCNRDRLFMFYLECWRHGVVVSVVSRMNEVTLRRAWLVLGWVTVCGREYHLGM